MKYAKSALISMTVLLAVALPMAVSAQDNGDTFMVGIFLGNGQLQALADGFIEEMTELGYVDGENITYLYSTPSENPEEIIAEAQSLVDAGADALLAVDQVEAAMLKELTSEIPIVFAMSADPIGGGLVESFEEPGGNITGIEISGYHLRQLQLLVEMDPSIKTVYFPLNTALSRQIDVLEAVQEEAKALGVEIYVGEYNDIESALEAIASIPDDIDAIFLTDRLLFVPQISAAWVAASMRLQVDTSIPAYVPVQGVLMGYGPDPVVCGKQAAGIVDRLVRGADPMDLPVESAEYFLNVNLETAMAIGLDVPRGILRQADSIVRPGDLDEGQ